MMTLIVNGQRHEVDVAPDTPLLWVLRDALGLTGAKYGCGQAACGACTVHVNGSPMRSCVLPVSAVAGGPIPTWLLYTSDAAHGPSSVDLGGSRV
ncbi:MAG TPA: hypothetical protein DIC59_06455, partial [Candidatus Competibacteraceae bacterium]|nr:hypothetical protein [Candidatus Competibacteraceae bacterium]